MIANKPNCLDAELWPIQLGFFGKEHQSRNSQSAQVISDMCIFKNSTYWNLKFIRPFVEYAFEVLIKSLGIYIILRSSIYTVFIHLILMRIL